MSVSLVSNAYLDDNSTKIRSKPVPWEVRTSLITSSPLTSRRDTSVRNLSPRRSWPSSKG